MTSLLLDTPLNSSQGRYAEMIQSSSESFLTVLNDILDISKIQAGRIEFTSAPFRIPAVLEEMIAPLRPRALRSGLDLASCV